MQKYFLLIPLAFIVLVSGCTVPGTNIAIPFLPNLFGPPSVDYENDIVVIRDLQVAPSTVVKSGQTITLYADIENLDRPEKDPLSVTVDLFDYCVNLFDPPEVNCPGDSGLGFTGNVFFPGTSPTGTTSPITTGTAGSCEIDNFHPRETHTVRWELTPKDVSLEQECELKLRVIYTYETEAITQISFINEEELNNRIRRGESYKISGFEARGEGPVKPFLRVESQQPIPDNTGGQISLQVKNVGFGFVPNNQLNEDVTIEQGPVDLTRLSESGGQCVLDSDEKKFINKETPPIFCKAEYEVGDEIETTVNLKTAAKYNYEFRSSIKIKVVPQETPL